MTLGKNLRCMKDWISHWGRNSDACTTSRPGLGSCVWESFLRLRTERAGSVGAPALLLLLKNMHRFSPKQDKMSEMKRRVLGWLTKFSRGHISFLCKSVSCLDWNNHKPQWFDEEDPGYLLCWETGGDWALETEMQSLGDLGTTSLTCSCHGCKTVRWDLLPRVVVRIKWHSTWSRVHSTRQAFTTYQLILSF